MSSSSSRNRSILTHLPYICTTSALLVVGYYWHKCKVRDLNEKWERERKAERTGRIRAECKLREIEKQKGLPTASKQKQNNNSFLQVEIIGTVTSPYTKRMGTPRQPQLVPASRGFIQFTVPAATLEGIDSYSHVWILFQFHANTNLSSSAKTKIRPPRGNGVKVGQLATRSPHRPNPIGLSLCEISQWIPEKRQLHIRGLDLVNGTPVIDIKPCVPWDVPANNSLFKAPEWVTQEDVIATVTFSSDAQESLKQLVNDGKLSPIYTKANDGFQGALDTLSQVLAQDPRSSHRGLKNNARGTVDDDATSSSYKLIFGQTQVEFTVSDRGAEVINVAGVEFDPSAFVDGIPLISGTT
jgi:tRNA-Thr(GGU) m(6)t(6)A37 methyltransferase TsaA